MRGRKLAGKGLILLLLFVWSFGITAYAYEIDPDEMKAVEAESAANYALVITQKKVVEECITTDDLYNPTDVLGFTVENRSQDTIQSFTLRFVVYTDDNTVANTVYTPFISPHGENRELYLLEKDGLELRPGESFEIFTAVDYGRFTGARAMIETCTLADGTVVSNPLYPTWDNLAFGLSGSNVTELD